MASSSDLVVDTTDIVDIHKLRLLTPDHAVALVVFTAREKFTFKGVDSDEVCVYSLTAVKTPAGWRVAHGQRSAGRKPEEPLPDFSAVAADAE
jgi:hypothetical protein